MSKHFLKKFKSEHKCPYCPKDKQSGYSLCPTHLEMARAHWEHWSIERRSDGLCCYCDRKSFRGWLRCRTHTAINRAKCKAWARRHPEHTAEQWERSKKIRDMGFCPKCREHRKLVGQFKSCEVCRTLNHLRDGKFGVEGVARIRDRLRKGLTTIQNVVSMRA